MPLLDLSGGDESGFEPVAAGVYDAEIFSAEMTETKGTGKLPKCPMIKVRWKLTGTDEDGNSVEGRAVFQNLIVPPEKVDGKKYEHHAMMAGQIVRFFEALGFDKDEVKSGNFDPDLEELTGRVARIIVSVNSYTDPETEETIVNNNVKGVKKAAVGSGSGVL